MHNIALLPLLTATWETIYMVFIASVVSILLGLSLGVLLFVTGKNQALESSLLNRTLGFLVNITRSTPYIILMISLIPLTRLLIGTTIGTNAAIVPLSIAAIPFFARITESALTDVPAGLIEAAHAMGASTWQLIIKILIPESLPALIRGATLTIIGLIGYSAMAGVVGGGGLGELAINYGYQRFNVSVMVATVIILIVMVQGIQWFGDHLAKTRKLTLLYISVSLLTIATLGYQCWPSAVNTSHTLRIGIMSGTQEDIMRVAKQVAKKDYGLNIQLVTFNDYIQPNTALNNDSIDANIFQHAPYLNAQMAANHYQLAVLAKTFVYPMGFYSKKITNIKDLPNNALVAIPNDPSNGGRALLLLQNAGLIQLKQGTGTLATINDIVRNPLHLRFKLLDAAELPRVLNDADLVAITNDFVGPAGLSIKQAVLKEDARSPYANIIVVRQDESKNALLPELIAVMHSKQVVDATEKAFPNGAAIPAW